MNKRTTAIAAATKATTRRALGRSGEIDRKIGNTVGFHSMFQNLVRYVKAADVAALRRQAGIAAPAARPALMAETDRLAGSPTAGSKARE